MNSQASLLEYRRDVYSQTGEDGVVERILELLPETDRWCVEFGAWDGQTLSNTRNLIEAHEYSAVLIEADDSKARDLERNYAERTNVIAVNGLVAHEGPGTLDDILGETPIPRDFDLLSIDIDGMDYHVWRAVERYRPKVVVVEFNPTIPTEVDWVQPADPELSQGASLLALTRLANEKGYELVSVLPYNAFFVRREYYEAFGIEDNSPATLRTDTSRVTYVFTGYDGRTFLHGSRTLPWHRLAMHEGRSQQLPRMFQSYPDSFSTPRRVLFEVYRAYRDVRVDPADPARRRKLLQEVRSALWKARVIPGYLVQRAARRSARR